MLEESTIVPLLDQVQSILESIMEHNSNNNPKEVDNTHEIDVCFQTLTQLINKNPISNQSDRILFLLALAHQLAGNIGLSFYFYNSIQNKTAEVYSNLGRCVFDTNRDIAEHFIIKSLQLNPNLVSSLNNLAVIEMQKANPRNTIRICNNILIDEPNNLAAIHNLSLAKIMLRDDDCWFWFNKSQGVEHRQIRDFGVPEWRAEDDGTVLVYTEQGLGDEIMFGSCLLDLLNINPVVFFCDPRMVEIWRYSGIRWKQDNPQLKDFTVLPSTVQKEGLPELGSLLNFEVKTQIMLGQLPYFFPPSPKGKILYNPEIRLENVFNLNPNRPTITFAMKGGDVITMGPQRSRSVETFDRLLQASYNGKINLINLDYCDHDEKTLEQFKICDVFYNPKVSHKTEGDMKLLMSVVEKCDYIITVCQTILWFGGASGVTTDVLCPRTPPHTMHLTGEKLDWYESINILRDDDFEKSIDSSINNINNNLGIYL